MQSVVRHAAQITITLSHRDGPAYTTTVFILWSLTKYLLIFKIYLYLDRVDTAYSWKHVAGLDFADRDPMSSDPINIIIGANLFGALVFDGVQKGSEYESIAQNTTFGGFCLDQ